jgi:deoxyribonuclease V
VTDSGAGEDRERLQEYRRLQAEMAQQVREQPLASPPRVIAAVDVHLRSDRGVAVAVAVTYPNLETIEERSITGALTFPYIPGLLSFREAPLCLAALRSLSRQPDLILVDGQGRAHPRRFGIACHLGVELQIPAIGVAKSVLTGSFDDVGEERGSTSPMRSRGEVIGMAVRTRSNVTPVYVSVGNLITLDEAVEWTLKTTSRFRLPEPSRRAHRSAKDLARNLE